MIIYEEKPNCEIILTGPTSFSPNRHTGGEAKVEGGLERQEPEWRGWAVCLHRVLCISQVSTTTLPRNLTSHWHSFSIHKFAGWGSGRLRMGLTLRLKGFLGQMLHGKWHKRQANHASLLRAPAHVSPANIPLTEANPGQRHWGGEQTRLGGSHGKGRGGRIPYKYGNWHP